MARSALPMNTRNMLGLPPVFTAKEHVVDLALARKPERISNRLEQSPAIVCLQDAIPLNDSRWFHDQNLFPVNLVLPFLS